MATSDQIKTPTPQTTLDLGPFASLYAPDSAGANPLFWYQQGFSMQGSRRMPTSGMASADPTKGNKQDDMMISSRFSGIEQIMSGMRQRSGSNRGLIGGPSVLDAPMIASSLLLGA